jgi:AP-2 complex subunit mu-1
MLYSLADLIVSAIEAETSSGASALQASLASALPTSSSSALDFGSTRETSLAIEQVRAHFVPILELFDEAIDFGHPQVLSKEVLKLLSSKVWANAASKKGGASAAATSEATKKKLAEITGAVSWRPAGIHYKKNVMFMDVIERINVLVSPSGNLLEADVSGVVKIRAFVSGMPECRLVVNDKLRIEKAARGGGKVSADRRKKAIQLDDVTFHQCVRLQSFAATRRVSFVPPDGEFELMRYRATENISLPFRIRPMVKEISSTRVEYKVTAKATFSPQQIAYSVLLKIPTPPAAATAKISVSHGKAKYVAAESAIVWKISRWIGGDEHYFSAEVGVLATISQRTWSRPPISAAFTIPMFAASGVRIDKLEVVERKEAYTAIKLIRYITENGNYSVRF